MKDFKDKVAVVTGAASGIGYGLAERCAKEGMKVVLADIEEDALAKAENNIKALGAAILAVKTDVSKASDVEELAKKTIDKFGAVHLLFNNAGVSAGSITWLSTLKDWQWILGTNLWGVIHGVYFFVPIMLKQTTECHIVNTASVAGLISSGFNTPYTVTKHSIVALSESLCRELTMMGTKIGVSVICPGYIRTNIISSWRNRPDALKNEKGEGVDMDASAVQEALKAANKLIDNGMPPQQAADIVFAAIQEKKFYILPNAEVFKPLIQQRMEDVTQGRNPSPFPVI
jgi:NAD(P)-dependent dehydrogenase (short-subunit alcohol dehydrogenase family)